eukprot:7517055-Ditylum_brightwellii.AAC.1
MCCWQGKTKEYVQNKQAQKPKSPGERIFLDIATIKGQKAGPKVNPKRNWQIMVDKRLMLRMSHFFDTKSGMVEPTLEQFGKAL